MRQTLEAIGLRNHQAEVIKKDSPALRGQIKRVRHLVTVETLSEAETQSHTDAKVSRGKAK
jgi:ribosomal protein L30